MNPLKGLSRPARLAGVVLLGVALVALVIGTVAALGGGSSQSAAPSTSAGERPGTSSAPPAPATTTHAPSTTPQASATQAPPATSQAPVTSQDGQTDAKWVPVRVFNNSTIKGLAARAAADFRANGWTIAEAGNYPYGIIPTTTAYYTPGTDEETAAKALAAEFGMKADPRFEGIQNSSPGVIVIVTDDYQGLRAKDG